MLNNHPEICVCASCHEDRRADLIAAMKQNQPQTAQDVDLSSLCSAWRDIASAPRDGTSFVWMHYITVLGTNGPHEYKPYVDVLRRAWINEDKVGRQGDGYWMGQYGSRSDYEVCRGYWMPLHPAQKADCHPRLARPSCRGYWWWLPAYAIQEGKGHIPQWWTVISAGPDTGKEGEFVGPLQAPIWQNETTP